jgi:hypothetical protein
MTFAKDRDLLALEPRVFGDVAWTAQKRAAGSDGVATGLSLSSASADFVSAGVDAGHVVVVDGVALEVTARVSATELNVSLLRDSALDAALAPTFGAGAKGYSVFTFGPQIGVVHGQVMRALGLEVGEEARIVNGNALVLVEALGALHLVYSAAAALTADGGGLAMKAAMYRERVALERSRVAAHVDTDGDGEADVVRRLNTIRFVRAS